MKRRAKQDFRQHAAETDAAKLDQLWTKAQEDFAVTQRQRVVYSMYAPKQKSVMVSSPSDRQLQWLAQPQAALCHLIKTSSHAMNGLLGCLEPSTLLCNPAAAAQLLQPSVEGTFQPSVTAASATLEPYVLLQLITLRSRIPSCHSVLYITLQDIPMVKVLQKQTEAQEELLSQSHS